MSEERCHICGEWDGKHTPACSVFSVPSNRELVEQVYAKKDAQIAALTERLRIVEAERDEARSGVKRAAESYGALMSTSESLRAQLSALRAELARKDAALKGAREERVDAAKRLSKQAARWLDDFIADSELIDAINGELDAALQPKEPPCQTA